MITVYKFRLSKISIIFLVSDIIHIFFYTGQQCTSLEDPNKVCLTIENLRERGFGFLAAFMKGGDPCFMNPKHKFKRV